jgi:hypothetical protein
MTAIRTRPKNFRWAPIIEAARDIVESYDTLVTLRQLFYRLVAAALILNTDSHYKRLSDLTAQGRRDGTFPDLIDNTRWIHRDLFHHSAVEAIRDAAKNYRGDRLAGQPYAIYLGTEKRGLIAQLEQWFGDQYGIPILPLGGFSSQSFIDDVIADTDHQRRKYDRKAILLYAGDFDASGVTIDRVFNERTPGCWAHVERIALNPEQVAGYELIRQRGKHKDPNIGEFVRRFGDAAVYDPAHPHVTDKGKRYIQPVQVEMDALDPVDLRRLFADAIFGTDDEPGFWDMSAFEDALPDEQADREHAGLLAQVAARFSVDELRRLL